MLFIDKNNMLQVEGGLIYATILADRKDIMLIVI